MILVYDTSGRRCGLLGDQRVWMGARSASIPGSLETSSGRARAVARARGREGARRTLPSSSPHGPAASLAGLHFLLVIRAEIHRRSGPDRGSPKKGGLVVPGPDPRYRSRFAELRQQLCV